MSEQAVRDWFEKWNTRDIDGAMAHVSDECVYDDFSFVRRHEGKASVRALFENVAAVAPGVGFLIHRVTGERDCGVVWEVTVDGKPTGRMGVSYYAFDDDDRLVWALDAADPGPAHRTNDFHTAPG
jgi:hypothetical protein